MTSRGRIHLRAITVEEQGSSRCSCTSAQRTAGSSRSSASTGRDFRVRWCICFTGTAPELEAYLALDLHIEITGWICDERRGVPLRALIPRIPRDRLMIETDAPFLLPRDLPKVPAGGRNEPALLPHVLAAVARAAAPPEEIIAEETSRTARAFFRIG